MIGRTSEPREGAFDDRFRVRRHPARDQSGAVAQPVERSLRPTRLLSQGKRLNPWARRGVRGQGPSLDAVVDRVEDNVHDHLTAVLVQLPS